MNSVKIVEDFWVAVWKSRNPDAIADFVVEDAVITTGGVEIKGRDKFIAWAKDFLSKINDFGFEVIETFQNEDGSRVASLWRNYWQEQRHDGNGSRPTANQFNRDCDLERARRRKVTTQPCRTRGLGDIPEPHPQEGLIHRQMFSI